MFNEKSKKKETLFIVPFEDVPLEMLDKISSAVSDQMPLQCRITEPEEIPDEAFNLKRNQFISDVILKHLRDKYAGPGCRVLGVVEDDLYTANMNFIFGQADVVSAVALISLARLMPHIDSLKGAEGIVFRRALIEAIHELGHTYGLKHCSNPECVMFFSNSLRDTDMKTRKFCARCMHQIREKW